MKTVLVVGTLDTKGTEIAFCREQIEAMGAKVLLLDGGVLGEPTIKPDITREEVAAAAGTTIEQVRKFPAEGDAIGLQAQGAGVIALRLHKEGKIHGVLGIGGGMGTVLGTGTMRALPIGVPKFMVSSQAGNPVMSRLVGTKDICMFHSVTDVPDDHFAVWLTTLFIAAAGLSLVNEAFLVPMYIIAAVTFIYIPLGKIRHCLYFFFSRFFYGRFFGRRAVFPHNVDEGRAA